MTWIQRIEESQSHFFTLREKRKCILRLILFDSNIEGPQTPTLNVN